MKKRLLSIFLTLCLVLSLAPTALAAEGGAEGPVAISTLTEDTNGTYDGNGTYVAYTYDETKMCNSIKQVGQLSWVKTVTITGINFAELKDNSNDMKKLQSVIMNGRQTDQTSQFKDSIEVKFVNCTFNQTTQHLQVYKIMPCNVTKYTFESCTFNQAATGAYAITLNCAETAFESRAISYEITNSTISSKGRGINITSGTETESLGANKPSVVINNNTFTLPTASDNNMAIQIAGNWNSANLTAESAPLITVSGNTITAYAAVRVNNNMSNNTGDSAKYMAKFTDNVLSEGTKGAVTKSDDANETTNAIAVYYNTQLEPVAQVGDKMFTSLSTAVAAAQPGDTITLLNGQTVSSDSFANVSSDNIVRKDSETSYTVVAKENLTSGVYMSDPSGSVASGYVVSGSGPYTVSVYIPTTTTTTTTNDDGSKTTTTTDKSTGATTETTTSQPVTDEAGNTTQTTTETVTQKDGSTTETVTETVKAADGSTTETVTETATNKDGATTSTTETVTTTDTAGTTATKVTETDAAGEATTAITAVVSDKSVTEAAQEETSVTLPVEVTAAAESEAAPVVTVQVPATVDAENTVKVEIPVENLTTGTVAVIVNEDGTEEIVKTSTMGEEGVVLTLEGDATVKIVDNSKIFEDVHPVDHWAEDAVTYVAARDIFNGTGTSERNTFSPDEDLNRAMLMTVLARYDGEDTSGGETWYEQGMNWAMQTGVSDGTNPEVSITREEMVTMLWRYAGKPESSHALDFTDAHDINDWAETAMRWAVSTGIINGVDNNTLDPQGPATRAQVATVMMRFCEKINK